jgi:hypothetical protein
MAHDGRGTGARVRHGGLDFIAGAASCLRGKGMPDINVAGTVVGPRQARSTEGNADGPVGKRRAAGRRVRAWRVAGDMLRGGCGARAGSLGPTSACAYGNGPRGAMRAGALWSTATTSWRDTRLLNLV